MFLSRWSLAALALMAVTAVPARAEARTHPPVAPPVRGIVTDESGQPLANARVTLTPSRRVASTDGGGVFLFRALAPGNYHIDVSLFGYAPAHAEIMVPEEGEEVVVRIQLTATPLALEGVIVTATPGGADPLTISQSTTQLSGRQLDRQIGTTVAATLEREPGISTRYAGPAAAMPVIRGLTGDRVVMLENGQRTGDLSGSAADHALSVDPLNASRVEVVRGPASLLYGSGALGGVVNVIGTDIAANVPPRAEGSVALQGLSATPGGALSAQVTAPLAESFVLTARGGFRDMNDVRVGGGETLVNTYLRNLNGNLGLGYVSERWSGGIAVNGNRFDYGVPFGHSHDEDHEEDHDHADEEDHEHAGVDLTGSRYEVLARSAWTPAGGALREITMNATAQWYHHDEIEPSGEVGTTFVLRTQTVDLRTDTDIGRARGTVGVSGLLKQYEPTGEEALTPFARSGNAAAFIYQEMPLVPGEHDSELVPHLQLGARFDHYDISTDESGGQFGPARSRQFHAFSGSAGLNFPFPEGISIGGSVARAFRTPSVEELYSNGLHAATSSFDVGNPDLQPEMNLGLEGIFRAHSGTVTALVSAFYNHIDNFIAPEIVGDTAIAHDGETLVVPLNHFFQEDASLLGVEGDVEVLVGRSIVLGARGDRVRGRFRDGSPLPYMPAARIGGNVRWDDGTFSAGIDVLHAFAPGEVPINEFATESYSLVNLSVGYTHVAGGLVHALTLRADNLADTSYRDATSRIKALAPNPGRDIALVYRLLF